MGNRYLLIFFVMAASCSIHASRTTLLSPPTSLTKLKLNGAHYPDYHIIKSLFLYIKAFICVYHGLYVKLNRPLKRPFKTLTGRWWKFLPTDKYFIAHVTNFYSAGFISLSLMNDLFPAVIPCIWITPGTFQPIPVPRHAINSSVNICIDMRRPATYSVTYFSP